MAHRFPQRLTEQFTAHHVSSEKRIYDAAAELDDSFYVFHDLAWDNPSLGGDADIGQADFVLAHPEYGFIALEVKGGRCSYTADSRTWSSEDRVGEQHTIKDPFDQAHQAGICIWKQLLETLRDKIYVPKGQSAVVFPDCDLPREKLSARIPAWRIITQEDLFNFSQTVHRLFEAAFPGSRTKRSDGLLIIDELKRLWGIVDVDGRRRLSRRLDEARKRLVELTDRQLSVLQSLNEAPRVLVRGCAGSGKTTLAVHKARMLADDGKKVGLFCFNIPLGRHLQQQCETHTEITAGPVAELFVQWLREVGVDADDDGSDDWWDVQLPNLVLEHLDSIPHRFDGIIVDEGQDIREQYWTVLELLVTDAATGVFYIFSDEGQNIYHGRMNLSFHAFPFTLNRNVRNTNQVFEAIKACCDVGDAIEASGVDGSRPELYDYADESEMMITLEQVLARLYNSGISPRDIALLGTRSQSRTILRHGDKIGAFRMVPRLENENDIRTMTVHRFKGLEAKVIILCEIDDAPPNIDELLYIGMTRTTGHLVVLATGDIYRKISTHRKWVQKLDS